MSRLLLKFGDGQGYLRRSDRGIGAGWGEATLQMVLGLLPTRSFDRSGDCAAIANASVRDRACLHGAGVSPAVLSGAG
jgi:hypothetical protein